MIQGCGMIFIQGIIPKVILDIHTLVDFTATYEGYSKSSVMH